MVFTHLLLNLHRVGYSLPTHIRTVFAISVLAAAINKGMSRGDFLNNVLHLLVAF